MRTKKLALLLALSMILSLIMPVITPAQPLAANASQNAITDRAIGATSPASLTIREPIDDGWTGGGMQYEAGYWVVLRAESTGILPNSYFQYDFFHGGARIDGLPANVTAAYFALDTRYGRTQAIFHFDFVNRPTTPEVWNNLVLTFDVNVAGNTESVITRFSLTIPAFGGTDVTTPPAITPPPPSTPRPTNPPITPTNPPSGGSGGNHTDGGGSGSSGGSGGSSTTNRPTRPNNNNANNGSTTGGTNNGNEGNNETTISPETVSDLFQNAIENAGDLGYAPVVTIALNENTTSAEIYASDILALIELGGSLVVQNDSFTLTFNADQLAAWGLDENSVVTINMDPTNFMPLEMASEDAVDNMLQSGSIIIDVEIDGQSMGSGLTGQLQVDISSLPIPSDYLESVIGAQFISNTAVPVGGSITNGQLSFAIGGSGEYGLMLDPSALPSTEEGSTESAEPTQPTQPELPLQPDMPTLPPAEIRLELGSTQFSFNGVTLESDVAPFIPYGGNEPMLPLRAVMEAMGATVGWDDLSRSVTVLYNGSVFYIQLDSPLPDGFGSLEVVNDRTCIPLSYVGHMLNIDLSWNPEDQTILIAR